MQSVERSNNNNFNVPHRLATNLKKVQFICISTLRYIEIQEIGVDCNSLLHGAVGTNQHFSNTYAYLGDTACHFGLFYRNIIVVDASVFRNLGSQCDKLCWSLLRTSIFRSLCTILANRR